MNKTAIFFSMMLVFSASNTIASVMANKFSQKSMENVATDPNTKNGLTLPPLPKVRNYSAFK